jgi:hypothetical protein
LFRLPEFYSLPLGLRSTATLTGLMLLQANEAIFVN